MNAFKNLISRYFEPLLVTGIILSLLFIDMFVVDKVVFLYFYFIPVLVAGYYIGMKGAVLSSIMTVLIVTLRLLISPHTFTINSGFDMELILQIITWGSFLILSSYVVGLLYEEKESRYRDLKQSYVGVVEILVKYIESVDRYTKGHSVRVADIAMDIAKSMSLSREGCENIKVAALLQDERKIMNTHSERGANILNKVGNVLGEAVPIVLAHHDYFNKKDDENLKDKVDIPFGARIIAVADTYDAIVTDRPYRKGKLPWQALEEIEKSSGTQFDPEVVEAFRHVVSAYMEENEHAFSSSPI